MDTPSHLARVTGTAPPTGVSDQHTIIRAAFSRAKCAAGLCGECNGLRLVARTEHGRARLYTEVCAKVQAELAQDRLANSGVPPTATTPPTEPIIPDGLTVWVGASPTSPELQALVRAAVEQGARGLYVLCPQAFTHATTSPWRTVAPMLAGVDLLVLDRWDRFRPSAKKAWLVDSLCRIIHNRSRAQQATVVKLTAPLRVVCTDGERDLFGRWIIG